MIYSKLPFEIKQEIFLYLPFETLIHVDNYVVKKMYKNIQDPDLYQMLWSDAVIELNLEYIKFFCNNEIYGHAASYMMNLAIKKGFTDIVKYIHYNCNCHTDRLYDNFRLYNSIHYHANLETIQFFHTIGVLCGDTIKILRPNNAGSDTYYILDLAIWRGDIEIVKWLYYNVTKVYSIEDSFEYARIYGNKEVVKFLKERYKKRNKRQRHSIKLNLN